MGKSREDDVCGTEPQPGTRAESMALSLIKTLEERPSPTRLESTARSAGRR